jgi:hypothetical protein
VAARNVDYRALVLDFLQSNDNAEEALDVIEVCLAYGSYSHKNNHDLNTFGRPRTTPEDAIAEINARFKEHGIGYQYVSGEIVRVDSQLLHEDAVKPALHVLRGKRFAAANEEFLKAHEHYRRGDHASAINEALKALESTLKVICAKQKWPFNDTDTAKKLLGVIFDNGLIPKDLENAFAGLRAVLENAVPTTRNRMSGHGAGAKPKSIPAYLAAYVLHVTASSILFLTEAEKQL